MNDTIYVIGHKNPDSDSICSAITYSDLMRRTGHEAIPCRQGPLNEETKFILKRFNQENPLLLTDARAMIKDITIDKPSIIQSGDTVHHAWHVMLQTRTRSLFVMDGEELVGVLTTSDLSRFRIAPETSLESMMATATLANIARTVGGEIAINVEDFSTNGKVHIITLGDLATDRYGTRGGISILSTNKFNQQKLIEDGAKLLILTCGVKALDEIKELAKQYGCAIIETDSDTMHTARVITESYSVDQVMSRKIFSFHDTDLVEDVHVKMLNDRVRAYPVLDKDGKVIGSISRYHTRKYNKRKFALVDHSSTLQTINNLAKAEIVAIVDHHNIGDVMTSTPIEYRNHICGCTCTIITKLYKEAGLEPDAEMSGLLLSAIISDTLNFKSATTTVEDIRTGKYLAERAGITDIDDYAREMLGASVALEDRTPEEIINRDLKVYEIGKHRIAIGQTNFSRMEVVQKILPEIKAEVKKEQKAKGLELLVMLFTDVMGEGSVFVHYGPLANIMTEVIKTSFDKNSGFDPEIISRKQQMVPRLSAIISELQ